MLTSSVLRFRARRLSFAPLMLEMQPHSRRAMAGREPALHLLSIPQRHGSFAGFGDRVSWLSNTTVDAFSAK